MKKVDFDNEFKNPGSEYRSIPFWAWNDELDTDEIRRQIREMKSCGIGGFFIHSRDGLETEYLSDKWFECVSAAVDEAKKNGMFSWLYDEDRWPSGTCGGSITATDKNSCKGLTLEVYFSVPEKIEGNVLALYKTKVYEMEIYSLERIRYAEGLILSDEEALLIARLEVSGKSEWFNNSAPPDNLSFDTVSDFINNTHKKYKKAVGSEFGVTIPGIFTDEPSLADRHASFNPNRSWIPWTEEFEKYFFEKRGYDVLDMIPYFYFNGEKSAKIRHDYWRTVSERFKEAYSVQIGDWCRENNLLFTGHFLQEDKLGLSCRVNGSVMPHYAAEDIQAIDMLTERAEEYITVKQCSSVSNQLGHGIVLSEMYGCTGWDFSFEGQKWVGDWQYALGVNQRCQHLALYSLRGCRKRDYPPSINCNTSWWKEYKTVEDYFARLSYMLRCGEPIRTVLVVHPMTTVWSRLGCSPYGNPKRNQERDIPKLNELGDTFNSLVKNLCNKHYDCDLGDEVIISEYGSCSDDKFVIGKCEYNTVIMPFCENLLSETYTKVMEFMENGGTVLGLAPFPRLIEGEVSEKLSLLINHHNFVKLFSENELINYLDKNVKREVSIIYENDKEEENILYQLRYDGNGYILFLSNNDRESAHEVNIKLDVLENLEQNNLYVYSLNLLTGTLTSCDFKYAKGRVCFDEYMQGCQSSMFYITNKYVECGSRDVQIWNAEDNRIKTEEIPVEYIAYEADTKNILALDMCRYCMDEKWSENIDVWKAQKEIRENLEMRQIYHNGLEQRYRWVNTRHKNDGKDVWLEFEFKSLTGVDDAELVIERSECFKIELDGKIIDNNSVGCFLDKSFKCIQLPKITEGVHKLRLQCNYTNDMELECCYILGDFGVCANREIIKKPESISLGDITGQGYFHYCGGIAYKFKCCLPELPNKEIYLISKDFDGVSSSAVINGREIKIPWKEAGIVAVGKFLHEGENEIVINVYGSPRNMLGPLHITNKPLVTKDSCFCPMGDNYSQDYNVVSVGLMKPPRLIYFKD